MPQPTVVSVTQVFQDYKMHVLADLSDGQCTVEILSYYNDEINFGAYEFIGKTQEQINQLFLQRDIAYLQS